jgi:hypothetical protein
VGRQEPRQGRDTVTERELTSTAAPEALAGCSDQPERDNNQSGASGFPGAHREPPTRLNSGPPTGCSSMAVRVSLSSTVMDPQRPINVTATAASACLETP